MVKRFSQLRIKYVRRTSTRTGTGRPDLCGDVSKDTISYDPMGSRDIVRGDNYNARISKLMYDQ